jgi:FKBP-type peptidyl-prolyl cis-trans isomerase SlyD
VWPQDSSTTQWPSWSWWNPVIRLVGRPSSEVRSQSGDALVTLVRSTFLCKRSYPMLIAANKAVSIDYTLTNDAGEVIDSSSGGAPLVYLHGAANIIPGLEKALEGKQAGDELEVAIEPEDAYGEYLAELVSTLNRSLFEGVDELEVGMQFHASAPDGQMQIVTIRDIDGDDVTVDGNHPLAGQRLNFKVKVIDVRDASEEEIAHRHIHGEGGHHH